MMKRTTIKDVAKHAGVSIGTVSKVLNSKGYVSKASRDRVLHSIKQLNYQVNANARSLKASKTNKIGVIMSDIANPYLMSIAKSVENMIRSIQCHMILMSHNEDEPTEKELLQLMMEQQVDALVLIPTGGNADCIQAMMATGIPIIAVDRKIEGIETDLIFNKGLELPEFAAAAREPNRHLC
jgi:LacI family transcriptional regulator